MYLQKVISIKNFLKELFVGVEKSRIRIWIHTKMSWIRNTGLNHNCCLCYNLFKKIVFAGGERYAAGPALDAH
jgi:hypothetical protein